MYLPSLKKLSSESEFIRFCIVGAGATFVDLAVFNITLFLLPYLAAAYLGFAISFGFNYYLTAKWTFRKKRTVKNFLGMIGVHLTNLLLIRTLLLCIIVEALCINERIGYLMVMAAGVAFSFIFNRFIFHKQA